MGFIKFKCNGLFNTEEYSNDIKLIELLKNSYKEINHPRQVIIEQLSEQYDLKLGKIELSTNNEGILNFETYGYPYGGTYWINQLIYELGGIPYLENDDVSISSLKMITKDKQVLFEKIK